MLYILIGGRDEKCNEKPVCFSVTQPPSSPILPGGSSVFTIRPDSSIVGTDKSAIVTILNNDTDEGSYFFTITAEVTATPQPEINVKQDLTNIPDDGSHTFLTTSLGSYTDIVFTIENLGSADLSLNGSPRVAIGGTDLDQFSVITQPPVSTIAVSLDTTFTVRFTPTSVEFFFLERVRR